MKNIITLCILMFFFATATFAQAEKTLIKSIASTTASVSVELPGEVSVKNWDKDFIRVTVTINSDNITEEALKKLVDFGRYEIVSSNVNGQTVLTMPKISNHVFFQGEQMNEIFSIEIQLPYAAEASLKTVVQNM